jgi:hypothetical protein
MANETDDKMVFTRAHTAAMDAASEAQSEGGDFGETYKTEFARPTKAGPQGEKPIDPTDYEEMIGRLTGQRPACNICGRTAMEAAKTGNVPLAPASIAPGIEPELKMGWYCLRCSALMTQAREMTDSERKAGLYDEL